MSIIGTPYMCANCDQSIKSFLDLGLQPLANNYLSSPKDVEPLYPLEVCFCKECKLVQLSHIVSPDVIFNDYPYFSSYTSALVSHAEEMAKHLIDLLKLTKESKILEIGSNDGYLLQYFKEHTRILGIEPATNVALYATNKGIPTLNRFFGSDIIEDIINYFGGKVDLIIGNNVLAHMPDINDVFNSISQLLSKSGVAVFEVPYLVDLIRNLEFDTIYHEHYFYFSVMALNNIAEKYNLRVSYIEHQNVHGGTIRIFLTFIDISNFTFKDIFNFETDAIKQLSFRGEFELLERVNGLDTIISYNMFDNDVITLKGKLCDTLGRIKLQDKSIAAYGAAAKGSTLLNYCGIDTNTIDFIVDISPHKQGKFMPGVHIPIYPLEHLLEKMPNYTLILPWNWCDLIVEQQSEYIKKGGKFILPIPSPMEI